MKLLAVLLAFVLLASGCVQQEPARKELAVIQALKSCTDPALDSLQTLDELELSRFRLLIAELTLEEGLELRGSPCVARVLSLEKARESYQSLPEDLKEELREELRGHRLSRTIEEEDLPEVPSDLFSEYQTFVTPEDPEIRKISSRISSRKAAYSEAVGWVWISEETLNGVREKWLTPNEFLSSTPSYPSNPVKPRIASDCSEQANALASLLRAEGVPPEEVRVVLGKVDFDGEVGGHAWIEVLEDGKWLPLDPTSGPYWDDSRQKLVSSGGLKYTYFKFFPFPSLEIWTYYNDFYFWNLQKKQGNAPASWR